MRSSDGNTKHRVPSTLVDRVLLSVASKPAVSWKLSGPYEKAQLKRRNFAQPRKGYSTRGWIWTMVSLNESVVPSFIHLILTLPH